MNDSKTTITELSKLVNDFVNERDWNQFHSPKNLSMQISAETAELMEHFLWCDSKDSFNRLEEKRSEVEQEVSDIFLGILLFCTNGKIDLTTALKNKLEILKTRYPIEKSKGKSTKYTEL